MLPLQNMKLTGDIIRVVNTLRFSKGVNYILTQ